MCLKNQENQGGKCADKDRLVRGVGFELAEANSPSRPNC